MAETLEKIQMVIKESKSIALLSKKDCEEYKLLAKEALEKALSEKNFNAISLPENPEFKKKWKLVIPEKKNIPFPQKTSIRIPKSQYKIKELNYENGDDFLNLVITAENGEINKDSVIFEAVLQKADAVFCFFDPYEAEALQKSEQEIIFPDKEKIIFFASNSVTYAEKISQVIRAFAPELFTSKEISTLLFASLITETNNFIRPISQEVLHFGSELLSGGADKEIIKVILSEEKTISFARLLGRSLARTHIDENSSASWTFLSAEDIKKTGNENNTSLFFYNIIRNVRDNIPYKPLSFLFWEDGSVIRAITAADEEKNLVPLAGALNIKLQSKYFTAGPFKSFSEAEMIFKNALKESAFLRI